MLAIAGSAVIMGRDLGAARASHMGALLGIIAAVFYAAYHLVSQKGRSRLSTLVYFWLSSLSATLSLLIINLILQHDFTGYSLPTWLNFVVLGIVVQVCGWLLISYSQGYVPASILAPSLLGQPVFTALLAWLILSEALTAWEITGGSIVLLGIFVVHRYRRSSSS